MRINTITCDGCGLETPADETAHINRMTTVQIPSENPGYPVKEMEFCNIDCLTKWAIDLNQKEQTQCPT